MQQGNLFIDMLLVLIAATTSTTAFFLVRLVNRLDKMEETQNDHSTRIAILERTN